MTPVLGSISLSLALGISAVSILLFSLFLKSEDYRFYLAGWRAALSVSVLSILATFFLLNELLISNFDIN